MSVSYMQLERAATTARLLLRNLTNSSIFKEDAVAVGITTSIVAARGSDAFWRGHQFIPFTFIHVKPSLVCLITFRHGSVFYFIKSTFNTRSSLNSLKADITSSLINSSR